jgi:hypothetical protein
VRAKTVINCPAAVMLTDTSLASPGRSAAIMKLSVPVAKVPKASQSKGRSSCTAVEEAFTFLSLVNDRSS